MNCVQFRRGRISLSACELPPTSFSWHRHSSAELVFSLRGSFSVSTGTISNPGWQRVRQAVVYRPPSQEHSNRVLSTGRTLALHFDHDFFLRQADLIGGPDFSTTHISSGSPFAMAQRVWSSSFDDDSCDLLTLEMTSLVFAGLASIVAHIAADRRPPWLKKIKELMVEECYRQIPIAELTDMTGVSASHLIRSFKLATGRTIGEFQRQARISKAIALLNDSNHSLAGIAAAAGFSDQSHMTRIFKKHLGYSPGQMRSRRVSAAMKVR